MTTDLRERLDDLLTEVPSHVHADPTTAWSAGARRRVRRRLVTGGALLALLGIVGGAGLAAHGVTDLPPADGGSETPSLSYPVRIEHPLVHTGTLSPDAGAIAGLVQRRDGWYAVGQHGQVWNLAGGSERGWLPALSPNGSRLAYVRGHGDRPDLVLLDLRAGRERSSGLKPAFPTMRSALPLNTQMFWSPDSTRLLVPVVPGAGEGEPIAMVIGASGHRRSIAPVSSGHPLPAGWYDDRTLVWVTWKRDPEAGPAVDTVTAILTTVSGDVVRRIPLQMKHAWTAQPDSGSVSVSPNGNVLVLRDDEGDSLLGWWFRLRGPLRGQAPPELKGGVDRLQYCPTSWGENQEVPTRSREDDAILSEAQSNGPTIYADPRLHISCSVWASDALGGTAYRDLTARVFDDAGAIRLGTTSWLSWHWRQVAVGTSAGLLVVAAGLGLWLRRRRERRLTASQAAG